LLNPEFKQALRYDVLHPFSDIASASRQWQLSASRNVDVNHVEGNNCAAIKLLDRHEDKVKSTVREYNAV
jgi:hypothetical protein